LQELPEAPKGQAMTPPPKSLKERILAAAKPRRYVVASNEDAAAAKVESDESERLLPLLQVLAEGMEALDAVNEDMSCACQTAFESMYREILYAARAKARAALSAVEAEVSRMEGMKNA
jgi:hypothetical protein